MENTNTVELHDDEIEAVNGAWFYDNPIGMPEEGNQLPRITFPGTELW